MILRISNALAVASLVILGLASGSAHAQEILFNPVSTLTSFSAELVQRRFATPFVPAGIQGLRDVRFQNLESQGLASAIYYVNQRAMVLNSPMWDGATRRLKPIATIGLGDTSTVLHELWHSYYWTRVRGTGSTFDQIFRRNYTRLYGAYPANRREEIHEEAYGTYVQYVTRQYLYFQGMMAVYSSEQRKNMRENPRIQQVYENEFKASVKGYYQQGGRLVNSTVAMSDEDKQLILTQLFGGQVKGTFAADFPETVYP